MGLLVMLCLMLYIFLKEEVNRILIEFQLVVLETSLDEDIDSVTVTLSS